VSGAGRRRECAASSTATGPRIGLVTLLGLRRAPALSRARRDPEPLGEEEAVADHVRSYLRDLGVETDAADPAGNLLARLPRRRARAARRSSSGAHLDTVPASGPIEPVVADGVVTSAADTILGADDKAAVAVLLESARLILAEGRQHAGVELLFTTREETAFEARSPSTRRGSRPDSDSSTTTPAPSARSWSRRVGPGDRRHVHGRPAHAGINPEDGRSASWRPRGRSRIFASVSSTKRRLPT